MNGGVPLPRFENLKNGPKCPSCGSRITKRNGTRNGKQLYKCMACGHQFHAGDTMTDKEIWTLYQASKQTVGEIASITGKSPSTIKRRLRGIDIKWETVSTFSTSPAHHPFFFSKRKTLAKRDSFFVFLFLISLCLGDFVYFCSQKQIRKTVTTTILEIETNNYWELLKNLSAEVKLALIAKLSGSLVREAVKEGNEADRIIDEILQNAPVDVSLSDEEIQQEINAVRYAV